MMSSPIVSVSFRPRRFEFTRKGAIRICMAVSASMTHRDWSGRRLSRESGLADGTISRYMSAKVVEPSEKVLRTLAKFVYKVVSIDGEEVKLDTSQVYEDWEEFAYLGTADYEAGLAMGASQVSDLAFGDTASRSYLNGLTNSNNRQGMVDLEEIGHGSGALARLIRAEMQARGLNPDQEPDFLDFVRWFPSVHQADIDYIRSLIAGRIDRANADYIPGLAFALRNFTGCDRYTQELLADLNNHIHSVP